MNKKLLIIVCIFFITLVVAAFILTQRAKQSEKNIPAGPSTRASAPPPSFVSPASETQPEYAISDLQMSFPSSLPPFSVSLPDLQSAAPVVAGVFGLTDKPSSFTGARGSFYTWNKNVRSLSVGADPVEISYSSGESPAGPVLLSVKELDAAARTLLQKMGIPGSSYRLSFLAPRYLLPSGQDLQDVGEEGSPTIIEINYQYTLNNQPLFSRRPDEPSVTVRFGQEGNVLFLHAVYYEKITAAQKTIPLLSVPEASSRIKTGRGVITQLFSDADKNVFDIHEYRVPVTNIQAISLGYYYSPGQAALAPVYVYRGTGKDRATGKDVKTTTIISAIQ